MNYYDLANPLQRVRLAIAKDALAALVPTHKPTAERYALAIEFLEEHGAEDQHDGMNPKRSAHLSVFAAQEEAIAYAAEKKRLTEALNAIRQEIYDDRLENARRMNAEHALANNPPSDLE